MMVRDEVCGMEIDTDEAAGRLVFDGKTRYFCSERCKRLFAEHPGWYVPVPPDDEVAT